MPIEYTLAGTLAPMLFAFAIFSLGALSFSRNYLAIFDEIFAFLAAICIFAAALLVDSILDRMSLEFSTRFSYLGFGYIFFCMVIGVITVSIPVLYLAKINRGKFRWKFTFLFFVGAGISVIGKMLTLVGHHLWITLMSIFFLGSLVSVIMNRGEHAHEVLSRRFLKWRHIVRESKPRRHRAD